MKCLHNWPEGPCQGELIFCDPDEPWSNEKYICDTCDSTYNVWERMKPVYAMSYAGFVSNMILSKLDDSNIESKNSAVIEVMGEQDLLQMPHHFKQDHPNVLRLLFDDVDEPLQVNRLGTDGREYVPVIPMSEAQGKQIFEFIKTNKDAVNFIVHCAAGISRSGAVAKFITEYFGGTDREFYFLNPYTKPNSRILNILRKLSQE